MIDVNRLADAVRNVRRRMTAYVYGRDIPDRPLEHCRVCGRTVVHCDTYHDPSRPGVCAGSMIRSFIAEMSAALLDATEAKATDGECPWCGHPTSKHDAHGCSGGYVPGGCRCLGPSPSSEAKAAEGKTRWGVWHGDWQRVFNDEIDIMTRAEAEENARNNARTWPSETFEARPLPAPSAPASGEKEAR